MKKSTLLIFFYFLISNSLIGQHGNVDVSFNPYDTTALSIFGGTDDEVFDVAVQADGKFLIGGDFINFNGQPANKLTRLLSNGQMDSGFNQAAILPNSGVRSIALQNDGKFLVAGNFTYWGTDNVRIVRLNNDGTRDLSFNVGAIANSIIRKVIVQSDQKIVVAGNFTTWNGQSANHIVRLNSDGTIDLSFSVGTGDNGVSLSNVYQTSDNGLILTGNFTSFNGVTCNGYVKLLPDGSVDSAFSNTSIPASSYLLAVQQQADGKIILAGTQKLFRLNSDGTTDVSFTSALPNTNIYGIKLLSNGKVSVFGIFSTFGGLNTKRIALLNSNGTIDPSFVVDVNGPSVRDLEEHPSGALYFGGEFNWVNTFVAPNFCSVSQAGQFGGIPLGANGPVRTISLQTDNKIIIGGTFTNYNGTSCQNIARLHPDGAYDSTFTATINGTVWETFVQTDGKILVANSTNLYRLNTDGSPETGFNVSLTDGNVNSIDVQPDGKILIAGSFIYVNGIQKKYLARLNANGTLETGFGASLGGSVTFGMQAEKVRVLNSGKIMVSGKFPTSPSIVRLHSTGATDNSFYFYTNAFRIFDFVELDNGDYVVGGIWSSFGGHSTYFLNGCKSNGSYDDGFAEINGGSSSGYTSDQITTITKLSEDKLLITGKLPEINSQSRACFIVDTTGARDTEFDVNEDFINYNIAYDAGFQSDGRIIVGGDFVSIGNRRRHNVARLHQTFFIDDIICPGGTYTFGSQTLTQAGTFTETFTSTIGTDSVVVLNLVLNSSASTLNITACDSFSLNNNTYYSSGMYTQILTNVNGCDSIVTLNLEISGDSTSFTAEACEHYVWNSQTYTSSGTYYQTLSNQFGCDSIVSMILTINLPDYESNSITAYDSLIWSANGTTYYESGIYIDTLVNIFGCDSVVTLDLTIIDAGLNTLEEVLNPFLFPNPTNGAVNVDPSLKGQNYSIYSPEGQLLSQGLTDLKIDLSDFADGIYFIHFNSTNPCVVRVVKNPGEG